MVVGYFRQEPPAPAAKVDELEQRLGLRLPTAYRDYLAECDGGRLDDNNEALKSVFGVGDLPERVSIWEKLELYRDRVPTWLLPVARDEYGNLFCLSLRDLDQGSVWFWDHEEEADQGEPPAEDNLTFKAAGWRAFLESLRPVSAD